MINMFWDDVYKFQLKRTGNEIEAEDITIESFAKAVSYTHLTLPTNREV